MSCLIISDLETFGPAIAWLDIPVPQAPESAALAAGRAAPLPRIPSGASPLFQPAALSASGTQNLGHAGVTFPNPVGVSMAILAWVQSGE